MEQNPPMFLVDQMLGELVRWLRILGYDTEYSKDSTDQELIDHSRKEGRVLVTSDLELHRRALKRHIRCSLLRHDKLVNKLSVLVRTYGLDLELNPAESRCPLCNGRLRGTSDLAELRDKVPSMVQEKTREFWVCENCGKVYWMGGHWKGITETIRKVRELSTSKN